MYNYDEFIKNLRLSDFAPFLAYGPFGQIAEPQYTRNGPPLGKTYFEKHPLARPGPQFAQLNNSDVANDNPAIADGENWMRQYFTG